MIKVRRDYVSGRKRRQARIHRRVLGTSKRPRLSVFRSGKHIYAQLIDDEKEGTLVSASDLKIKKGTKMEKALSVGEELAKEALKKKIKKVVFDRSGFSYHGRVEVLAEGARKGGLEF